MGGSISISVGNLWAVIDIPCDFHENHDFLSGPKITQGVYGSSWISNRYRYTSPHTVIRTYSAFKICRFLVEPVTHRLSPLISHLFKIGSLTNNPMAGVYEKCIVQHSLCETSCPPWTINCKYKFLLLQGNKQKEKSQPNGNPTILMMTYEITSCLMVVSVMNLPLTGQSNDSVEMRGESIQER